MNNLNIFNKRKNQVKIIFLLCLNLLAFASYSQVTGDYRTISGATNWDGTTSWERYNGASWVATSTPPATSFSGKITILHSITCNVECSLETLEIDDGATLTLTADMTVVSSLTLKGGYFEINGHTLLLADQCTIYRTGGSLSAAPSFDGDINIVYNQNSSEIETGYEMPSSGGSLLNLTINSSNGVKLNKDISVNGTLNFSNGKITIATYNLTIASIGTISNYSSSKYIVAGDGIYRATGGKVIRFVNSSTATADQVFPIGTATSYTPCYISNSNSTGTNFKVNLFDEVLENGNIGTPITGGVIKRTWNITPETEGNASSTTTIKIQWITSDEALNFNIGDISLIRNAAGSAPNNVWEASSGSFGSETGSSPYSMHSSGVTSFGYFTGKGGDLETGGTLPVTLLNIETECHDGKQNVVWSTASEINNDFFTIEKSDDASNWEILGVVPGSGNSNEMRFYNFLDRNENNGVVYYRLKQTDFNGSLSYSKVITSKTCSIETQASMEVFPNPFDGVINLSYNSVNNSTLNISVFDVTGKKIYKTEINSTEGLNTNSVDLNTLKDGMYYLKLENANTIENYKILKK